MKIVLYTDGYPFTGDTYEKQALGGSETAFIYIAQGFVKLGHEVYAYCNCVKEGIFKGVKYHSKDRIKDWTEQECDIFICSRYYEVFNLPLLAKKSYLWLHDVITEGCASDIQKILFKIEAIFCLSRYHANIVKKVLPSASNKIVITSNGVDHDFIGSVTSNLPKKHRIMFTSRAERGLFKALEIYEALNDPSLEFLYCSYTPLPSNRYVEYEQACSNKINDLKNKSCNINVDSFNKEDLYRAIAQSKCVLYPTHYPEISCISAMEAQACGTVFVSVADFALPETVGYSLLNNTNIDVFASELKDLLDNEDKRKKLEDQGKEHSKRFNWSKVAQDFIKGSSMNKKPTICLNMIVKNEASIITRCLNSVKPFIASWVIVDTGSTDGTQEVIKEALKDYPGNLIQSSWVNFGHNRNEALDHAQNQGEYLFFINADEVVQSFTKTDLRKDSYDVVLVNGNSSYLRKSLVRTSLNWRYKGVHHEYIYSNDAQTNEVLYDFVVEVFHDGARGKEPQRYKKDALEIELDLLNHPNDSRNVFYLAQSYRDCGDNELAVRYYQKRTEMGGWKDEIWYAYYQIAQIQQKAGVPWPVVLNSFLTAFNYDESRPEPLYRIAIYYDYKKEIPLKNLFLEKAKSVKNPSPDRLFIEPNLYTWLDEKVLKSGV